MCKEQGGQCRNSGPLGFRSPGVATELTSPGKVVWLNCQQSHAVQTGHSSIHLAQPSLHYALVACEMCPWTPQSQVKAYGQIPAPAPPAKCMHIAGSGSPCSALPGRIRVTFRGAAAPLHPQPSGLLVPVGLMGRKGSAQSMPAGHLVRLGNFWGQQLPLGQGGHWKDLHILLVFPVPAHPKFIQGLGLYPQETASRRLFSLYHCHL